MCASLKVAYKYRSKLWNFRDDLNINRLKTVKVSEIKHCTIMEKKVRLKQKTIKNIKAENLLNKSKMFCKSRKWSFAINHYEGLSDIFNYTKTKYLISA